MSRGESAEDKIIERLTDPGSGRGTYRFTVELKGVTEMTTELDDSLYNAGCGDGTLSSRQGRVYLAFDRKTTAWLPRSPAPYAMLEPLASRE